MFHNRTLIISSVFFKFAAVYVDFGEGKDTLVLSVDTNSAEKMLRTWNMEIKQIPCESSLLGEF